MRPEYYQVWGCDYLVLADMSVTLIELNAFPNMNHDCTPKGSKPRPHEMRFRNGGFDRDMLRVMGIEVPSCVAGAPNRWIDVTVPTTSD
jgi:hypothetical protein